ncbi:MAG: HD domain-containing protein [Flavobacteriales bacterium]
MPISSDILLIVEDHVNEVFNTSDLPLVYHNINHTYDVVEAVKTISSTLDVTDKDFETLLIAAWFHDIGYLESMYEHELHSANHATAFLSEKGIEKERIKTIYQCILATKLNATPNTLLEKILVDADLFNLGTPKHFNNAALLQEELGFLRNKKIEDVEWLKIEIPFLKRHFYQTEYGKMMLEPIKQEHLKQRINELNQLIK